MRLLSIAVLSMCSAYAQPYFVQTVAGGGLPENTPCTEAQLNGVFGKLAADSAGNVFIPVTQSNIVVRCDSATGTLTRVAGTGAAGFSDGENVPATSVRITSPSAVALDAEGNLYIAELGRIRKVSHGVVSTVAGNGIAGLSGDGGPAVQAEISPAAIAVDASGNVYTADVYYTSTGTLSELRQISGGIIRPVPGSVGSSALAVDSAGKVYLGDFQSVWRLSNGTLTRLTYTPGRAWALAFDASDNLYVYVNDSDYNLGTGVVGLFKFAGGTLSPIAVDSSWSGVTFTVDPAGNVYYTDSYADAYDSIQLDYRTRVRKVSQGVVTTIAGGSAAATQLRAPSGVAVDRAGNVYFCETDGNRVHKLANGVLTTVAGNGTLGFGGDGGPATAAQLAGPSSVAIDSQGNLYIADTHNQRIRKVVDGVITTVAGGGISGGNGDGGSALSAQLYRPGGIAVDLSGTLYISDDSNRVRRVSNGIITTAACNGTFGYAGDNVPATSAQCGYPTALALDGAGNLYFAESVNGYVRKVTPDGILTNIAGIGKQQGDGMPAVNAAINPRALAIDAAGSLYIGEDSTIRKVTGGIVSTIAGGGNGDGFARFAAMGKVSGIAVDSSGKLYFSDAGAQTIGELIAQPSTPVSITSVRNAGSNLQSWIAPGEIIAITGSGLGPLDLTMGKLTVDGIFDSQIAGASVRINGVPAPLVYASDRQVAAVVPYQAIVTGPAQINQITVTYQGAASKPVKIAGAPWVLGLFTGDGTGVGQAAAVNQDGSVNGASHPAPPGSVISLYATGEGATMPAGIDGKPASAPLPSPSAPIRVTIGGQPVIPEYAGGAPGEIAGLMQINVRIPAATSPGNAVPVMVEVPGYSSTQAGVTIVVGR